MQNNHALQRALDALAAAAPGAVKSAVDAGAAKIRDDAAFWRKVRHVFGWAHCAALRDGGAAAVVMAIDARHPRDFADRLALTTLRAAAVSRLASGRR